MAVMLDERFWGKVEKSDDPDGCHIWTGGSTPTGYGRFWYGGRLVYPHRLVLAAKHRCDLDELDGLEGRHVRCHNPRCCREDHLVPGDAGDNAQDALDAGRVANDGHRRLLEGKVAKAAARKTAMD